MLQEFITKSIFLSHKSIISALRSAEIVGRGIVDLSQNFRVSEFPSFRTSKKCRSETPYFTSIFRIDEVVGVSFFGTSRSYQVFNP